jgi:hypothetical protein
MKKRNCSVPAYPKPPELRSYHLEFNRTYSVAEGLVDLGSQFCRVGYPKIDHRRF